MAVSELLGVSQYLPADIDERLRTAPVSPLIEARTSGSAGSAARYAEPAGEAMILREVAAYCLAELLLDLVAGLPRPRPVGGRNFPEIALEGVVLRIVRDMVAVTRATGQPGADGAWAGQVARAIRPLQIAVLERVLGLREKVRSCAPVGVDAVADQRVELVLGCEFGQPDDAVMWCAVLLHEELLAPLRQRRMQSRDELLLIAAAGGCSISSSRRAALMRGFRANIATA